MDFDQINIFNSVLLHNSSLERAGILSWCFVSKIRSLKQATRNKQVKYFDKVQKEIWRLPNGKNIQETDFNHEYKPIYTMR